MPAKKRVASKTKRLCRTCRLRKCNCTEQKNPDISFSKFLSHVSDDQLTKEVQRRADARADRQKLRHHEMTDLLVSMLQAHAPVDLRRASLLIDILAPGHMTGLCTDDNTLYGDGQTEGSSDLALCPRCILMDVQQGDITTINLFSVVPIKLKLWDADEE